MSRYDLVLVLGVLAISGIAVAASRNAELARRWRSWALIVPVIGTPFWLGPGPTAALAALLAVQAVREFTRLVELPRFESALLYGLGVGYPAAAWLAPSALGLAALIALGCALPALVVGDAVGGFRRAALTSFGSLWLCWSLAHLVVVRHDAFVLCFATAAADIGAWCGGNGLRRMAWARRPLSPLSPTKTLGGLAGSVLGAVLILAVLGRFSGTLVAIVGLGAVAGDLLESMAKRAAGVKDSGGWLPGFGGLLDRIDSLLVVLPLAAAVLA